VPTDAKLQATGHGSRNWPLSHLSRAQRSTGAGDGYDGERSGRNGEAEWQTRCDIAALLRHDRALFGWTDTIDTTT